MTRDNGQRDATTPRRQRLTTMSHSETAIERLLSVNWPDAELLAAVNEHY
jgi:hypothetical protein